jgi:hypothetical protein
MIRRQRACSGCRACEFAALVVAFRVEELAWPGAALLPGVLPTQADLARESLSLDRESLEVAS